MYHTIQITHHLLWIFVLIQSKLYYYNDLWNREAQNMKSDEIIKNALQFMSTYFYYKIKHKQTHKTHDTLQAPHNTEPRSATAVNKSDVTVVVGWPPLSITGNTNNEWDITYYMTKYASVVYYNTSNYSVLGLH